MIDIKKIYTDSSALLEGHFLLSSKRHAKYYLQSAKVLQSPKNANILAKELAKNIKSSNIKVNMVCSPAIGGLIIGYELARVLDVDFIFTERKDNIMQLRRGFSVDNMCNIIVCEDIITTGKSAMECANVLKDDGANITAFASIANRNICAATNLCESSDGCKLDSSVPFITLHNFDFETYEPEDCPLCSSGLKLVKPGSRA